MVRVALLLSLLSTAAWAEAEASASARQAVRAALEARAELPRERPRFSLQASDFSLPPVVAVPATNAAAEAAKTQAARGQGVANGLERSKQARTEALERMEASGKPGKGKSAASRGAEVAKEAKSKRGGPPPGKGPSKTP